MTVRILVVCTANICRSPSAGLLLTEGLAGTTAGPVTAVSSAGTSARPGLGLCPVAGAHLPEGAASAELIDTHWSRPLVPELIDKADLVLTAARAHRGAVTRARPNALDRTFTLREAPSLAAGVAERYASGGLDDAPPLPPPSEAEKRLRWLIGEMHHVRGAIGRLAPPEPATRRRWWRRPEPDAPHPLDVPDSHEGGADVHEETFALLTSATEELAEAIAAVLRFPAGRAG